MASLAFLAGPMAAARAQDGGFVTPFTSVFISTGTLLMDVSKLNAHFERPDLLLLTPPQRTGYDAISNDGYSLGVGGYTPVGRLLLGGEFHYADLGEESSSAGKTNRVEASYGMATVGFAAFNGWRWTLYPFLGVGAGTVTLTLKDRNGVPQLPLVKDPSFDELILSFADQRKITGSYVMVQPGVGFDYLVLRSDRSHVGLVLGLRFSTAITPNRTTWKTEGRSVYGAPDLGPQGTMFRLVLGIGGFRMAQ